MRDSEVVSGTGTLQATGTAQHPAGVKHVEVVLTRLREASIVPQLYWNGGTDRWQEKYVQFPLPVDQPGEQTSGWSFTSRDLPAGSYKILAFTRGIDGGGGGSRGERSLSVNTNACPVEGEEPLTDLSAEAAAQCPQLANPDPDPDDAFDDDDPGQFGRLVATPRNGEWAGPIVWMQIQAKKGNTRFEVEQLTLRLAKKFRDDWIPQNLEELGDNCTGVEGVDWDGTRLIAEDVGKINCPVTLTPGTWQVVGTGQNAGNTALEYSEFTVFDPAAPQ